MTLEEFVAQERAVRGGVHHHAGVWWRSTSFGCCQPVYPLQEIEAGAARPKMARSFVRYSHVVPAGKQHNSAWRCLFLDGAALKGFCFDKLRYEKRKAINKARRSGLEIRRITDLEPLWPELQKVFMSTARRTGYGLPAAYYMESEAEWKRGLRREHGLPGRDWWGAFLGDTLVAYLYTCLVGETALLLVTKHDDAYSELRPSDLLHFEAIAHYRDDASCSRIYAGRVTGIVPSIDQFKAKFGFQAAELPVHDRLNRCVVWTARAASRIGGPIPSADPGTSRRGLSYWLRTVRQSIAALETDGR